MVSAHPGIASWCHVHSQITKTKTLESTLQLGAFKIHQKSTKSRSGPQGVLLGVLGDLRIIKMLPRGTQMHPQDIKMTNYSIQWET